MRIWSFWHQSFVGISLLILPATLAAAPAISFGEKRIEATGVSPFAKVVFFGVAREGQGYRTRVVTRYETVEDLDRDGVVGLELDAAVAFRSIWAAVDLTSGEYVVASPAGYAPTEVKFPTAGLRDQADGKLDRLEGRGYSLEVLVARPGLGAWHLSLGDGDPDDEDGVANGRIEWAVGKGRPVKGDPPAPLDFSPGDVVIAMDPTRMEIYAARMPGRKP